MFRKLITIGLLAVGLPTSAAQATTLTVIEFDLKLVVLESFYDKIGPDKELLSPSGATAQMRLSYDEAQVPTVDASGTSIYKVEVDNFPGYGGYYGDLRIQSGAFDSVGIFVNHSLFFVLSDDQGTALQDASLSSLTAFAAAGDISGLDWALVNQFWDDSAGPPGTYIDNPFYGLCYIYYSTCNVEWAVTGMRLVSPLPPAAAVPLPASLPLLLAGFGGLALLRRRG